MPFREPVRYFGESSKVSGFSGGAVVKNLPANARDSRDAGSILTPGRSPEGNPLQYSSLEKSMDRGADGGPGVGRPLPPWACPGGRLRDAAARGRAASAAAAVRRGPGPSPPASGGKSQTSQRSVCSTSGTPGPSVCSAKRACSDLPKGW